MKSIYIIEYNGHFVSWYETLALALEDIEYIDRNGDEVKEVRIVRLDHEDE